MTSLAEASGRRAAGGWLVWLALAVSLTLNVFFVGGLVWSHFNVPPPRTALQRFQLVAAELQLTGPQKEAFEHFAVEMRRSGMQLHEGVQPLMQHVWEELGKAQPDEAALARSVDQITDNRRAYQHHLTQGLTRFLATLSPEQRARFIELARQRLDEARHLRQGNPS